MVNIRGVVKVTSIPESACFTTFAQLLAALGQYLSVEIPDQNFSNVIISASQPGAGDTGKIWWRLGGSGTFIGMYAFNPNTNTWVQVMPPPGQVFWFGPTGDYPNSDTPPPGWSFDQVSVVFTGADLTALMSNAILDGAGPAYKYYPALWVGF